MTRYDAEHLLRLSEGKLCVRYFLRSDGTILTKDCPVGWARVKERVSVFATAAFSLLISISGGLFFASMFSGRETMGEVGVMGAVPKASPTPRLVPLMGDIEMPGPVPKTNGVMVGKIASSEPNRSEVQ